MITYGTWVCPNCGKKYPNVVLAHKKMKKFCQVSGCKDGHEKELVAARKKKKEKIKAKEYKWLQKCEGIGKFSKN